MISVLIVEDHSVVRMGVKLLINELYPESVVEESETFDEALLFLRKKNFDLLLLDIHLPGGDNTQMVEAVKLRQPDVRILIFSSYQEDLYALPYLDAGADGYLSKKSSPAIMRDAIQKVVEKGRYFSPQVMEQLMNQRKRPSSVPGKEPLLSGREMEVMHLMVRGAGTTEIKKVLNIRDSTVSTYKNNILRKMGVNNIVDLVNKLRSNSSA